MASIPISDEHPTNANTASFSRTWFVSADRLLWASAPSRFYGGSNKVLWERPGPRVSIGGRLLSGDAKGAVPTITGPEPAPGDGPVLDAARSVDFLATLVEGR